MLWVDFSKLYLKQASAVEREYVVNMVGRISSFSNYNMNKVTYGLHFAFESCCLTIWRQYTKRLVSFERKYHPSISVRQRGMDHIC